MSVLKVTLTNENGDKKRMQYLDLDGNVTQEHARWFFGQLIQLLAHEIERKHELAPLEAIKQQLEVSPFSMETFYLLIQPHLQLQVGEWQIELELFVTLIKKGEKNDGDESLYFKFREVQCRRADRGVV